MFHLEPVKADHAESLFPHIFQSKVTDTILWNGPEDLAAYQNGLKEKEALVAAGKDHMFTLFHGGSPRGSASVRPYSDGYRTDIGLWVAEASHNQGLGTFAVKELVNYAFQMPHIQKIEANVFTHNPASRRIFEKNGFRVEGTIRMACLKRGVPTDEWLLGLTRAEWETSRALRAVVTKGA